MGACPVSCFQLHQFVLVTHIHYMCVIVVYGDCLLACLLACPAMVLVLASLCAYECVFMGWGGSEVLIYCFLSLIRPS